MFHKHASAPEVEIELTNASISINLYSAYLSEILALLQSDPYMDENYRIAVERNLYELTSYIPKPPVIQEGQQIVFYPNEQLSKILIDNYRGLLNLATTYFNLSLSSHVVKYLVKLVYSLHYWEVYHLLYLIPDLDYFLKLVGMEVIETPFGCLVRPPPNLMVDSMAQGYEYPFPYPFYNYSYHSFDPNATRKKYERINIVPYSGLELKNQATIRKMRQLEENKMKEKEMNAQPDPNEKNIERDETLNNVGVRTRNMKRRASQQELDEGFALTKGRILTSPEEEVVKQAPSGSDIRIINNEDDLDGAESNSMSDEKQMSLSPQAKEPKQEKLASMSVIDLSMSGDQEYSNLGEAVEGKERNLDKGTDEESNRKGKSKSGVIHQCHLIDPHSMKPCLKIFYGKNELLRHQEFVHATKKKIYKCIYCSRNGSKVQSYPRHDSLARHIRRKHGVTGKENKMAVNYAKENVEIIDDPAKFPGSQVAHYSKPLPRPQFLNNDFTIKPDYAGFLLFSTRDNQGKHGCSQGSSKTKPQAAEVPSNTPPKKPPPIPKAKSFMPETPHSMMTQFSSSSALNGHSPAAVTRNHSISKNTSHKENPKIKFHIQPSTKYLSDNDKPTIASHPDDTGQASTMPEFESIVPLQTRPNDSVPDASSFKILKE